VLLCAWSSTSDTRQAETGSRYNTAKFVTLSLPFLVGLLCCSFFLRLLPVQPHLSVGIIDRYPAEESVGSSGASALDRGSRS
jgi:hypothetical protein